MGKYMKRSKITGDVAVMEVSPQSSIGVRTRAAKTLALQKLNKSSSSLSHSPTVKPDTYISSSSYLELRNRRLEKPPLLKQQQKDEKPNGCCRNRTIADNFRPNSRLNSGSVNSGLVTLGCEKDEEVDFGLEAGNGNELDVEASLGDNYLEFDGRNRSTRESTPCSLIMDSSTIGTPGSTSKRANANEANRRTRSDSQRRIPTIREMEEFFAHAEQRQQIIFMEKYNFDIVNDMPLPGRYEWVQLVP